MSLPWIKVERESDEDKPFSVVLDLENSQSHDMNLGEKLDERTNFKREMGRKGNEWRNVTGRNKVKDMKKDWDRKEE